MPSSLPSDVVPLEQLRLIVESYQRLTGKPLLEQFPSVGAASTLKDTRAARLSSGANTFAAKAAPTGVSLDEALWNAPFAIVAHGNEDDPIFFYGNHYALQCFEMSFDEFARLPSRLSAEPMAQESRDKALRKVAEQGYIDGYSGMRIAKSGRRFMITECTIWNLVDAAGVHHGQAAIFVAKN
jgi:hypothetical protein